jgi:hypothetical protein
MGICFVSGQNDPQDYMASEHPVFITYPKEELFAVEKNTELFVP